MGFIYFLHATRKGPSVVDASLRATILGALRQMTLDLQIPVVYITHDLATAYQIAENIVVLYRGAVVEAGDVELVVKDPRHPYTQLLIGSIPPPGVARTWAADGAPTWPTSRATCSGTFSGCWTASLSRRQISCRRRPRTDDGG